MRWAYLRLCDGILFTALSLFLFSGAQAAPADSPMPPQPKPAAGMSGQPDISPDALQHLHDLGRAAGKAVHETPYGLLIDGEGDVRTGNKLTVPVRIDVIAATDSNNIRLHFG